MPSDPTQLWQAIRQRPELYLGKRSVTALRHFLCGWSTALEEYQIANDKLPLPDDIHDWVAYRLGFHKSTSGWDNMIWHASPMKNLPWSCSSPSWTSTHRAPPQRLPAFLPTTCV